MKGKNKRHDTGAGEVDSSWTRLNSFTAESKTPATTEIWFLDIKIRSLSGGFCLRRPGRHQKKI